MNSMVFALVAGTETCFTKTRSLKWTRIRLTSDRWKREIEGEIEGEVEGKRKREPTDA